MSRPVRQHLPGGFYHVTLRGNHRQPIFGCDADRDALDAIVADVTDQLDTEIHAFCWMTNHLHAVVRVGDAPLGRIMQRIATRYARCYQRSLGTTGHLFERRYHAVLVAADNQLLATVRYVHLNPVRAGLTDDPANYRWSGHRQYLGLAGPGWLRTEFVLELLDDDTNRARSAYARFINEDITAAAPQTEPATQRTPPDQQAGSPPRTRPSTAPKSVDSPALDNLIQQICAQEQVTEPALRGRSRNRRLARIRARIAAEALESGAASLSDVARRFDRHIASLAKAISRRRKFSAAN